MYKKMNIMIFLAGVASGSAITWYFAKEKYVKMEPEETDSEKEDYSWKASVGNEETIAAQARHKPDISEYASLIHHSGYDVDENAEKHEKKDSPYVISPEQFGEMDNYEKISLTYFSDGHLADDDYHLINDPDAIIGEESLAHFGEYEDDSVFVRNDNRKCDYEILLDLRSYRDVVLSMPTLMEE